MASCHVPYMDGQIRIACQCSWLLPVRLALSRASSAERSAYVSILHCKCASLPQTYKLVHLKCPS